MRELIKEAAKVFLEKSKGKKIKIISHHDTDGITSAAIISLALKREDIQFSVEIVKLLEDGFIKSLSSAQDTLTVFLDLGSGSLSSMAHLNSVFIIDHHEIKEKPLENTFLLNYHLRDEGESICAAGLTYLFAKALNPLNKELANLAVIGMVGDLIEKIGPLNNEIIKDADCVIKRSLLLYPATRPIHKALEYSSSLYIPGVTGNIKGAIALLKQAGVEKEQSTGSYKSLIELNETEVSNLLTEIVLRTRDRDSNKLIGNIYLIKLFNKLEDAREISARINACGRLGQSHIALSFCLNNKNAKRKSEDLYLEYKQHLVSALNYASATQKIEGKDYVIINARDKIMDTIIGTVASILSFSTDYKEGTAIITMSYNESKIKASMRIVGKNGRNAKEIIQKVMAELEGEWGGHAEAAGCLIKKDDETKFIDLIRKNLEIEVVKI